MYAPEPACAGSNNAMTVDRRAGARTAENQRRRAQPAMNSGGPVERNVRARSKAPLGHAVDAVRIVAWAPFTATPDTSACLDFTWWDADRAKGLVRSWGVVVWKHPQAPTFDVTSLSRMAPAWQVGADSVGRDPQQAPVDADSSVSAHRPQQAYPDCGRSIVQHTSMHKSFLIVAFLCSSNVYPSTSRKSRRIRRFIPAVFRHDDAGQRSSPPMV